MLRTMEGRRRFKFDGPKTLIQHLQSTIDSLVSHDLERAARHVQIVDREDVDDGAPLNGYDSSLIVGESRTETQMIDALDAERQDASLPSKERQYEQLKRSGECKTAKDFARLMCITVSEVRNLERKRARRKRKQQRIGRKSL